MDVTKVDLNIAYVAMAIDVCCKCLFKIFHLLQTYVASVLSRCCICCSGYTHMLEAHVSIVSSALNVCCKKCFHIASVSWAAQAVPAGDGGPRVCDTNVVKVDLDVAYFTMAIHVCCKYLFRNVSSTSDVCCHLQVLLYGYCICCNAIHMCCKKCVQNVSSASDLCYRKCFHVASVSWADRGAGGLCVYMCFIYIQGP
jgi:hypothetical protein